MQEMSVAATTGEGGQMTVNVNGQQMNVTVPAGVKEGQNFTFQVPQAAQAVGTPVVAQAAPVVAQANYTPTGIPGVQLKLLRTYSRFVRIAAWVGHPLH